MQTRLNLMTDVSSRLITALTKWTGESIKVSDVKSLSTDTFQMKTEGHGDYLINIYQGEPSIKHYKGIPPLYKFQHDGYRSIVFWM